MSPKEMDILYEMMTAFPGHALVKKCCEMVIARERQKEALELRVHNLTGEIDRMAHQVNGKNDLAKEKDELLERIAQQKRLLDDHHTQIKELQRQLRECREASKGAWDAIDKVKPSEPAENLSESLNNQIAEISNSIRSTLGMGLVGLSVSTGIAVDKLKELEASKLHLSEAFTSIITIANATGFTLSLKSEKSDTPV